MTGPKGKCNLFAESLNVSQGASLVVICFIGGNFVAGIH